MIKRVVKPKKHKKLISKNIKKKKNARNGSAYTSFVLSITVGVSPEEEDQRRKMGFAAYI